MQQDPVPSMPKRLLEERRTKEHPKKNKKKRRKKTFQEGRPWDLDRVVSEKKVDGEA